MEARKPTNDPKIPTKPKPTYGNWSQERCLGVGAFGVVSLWKNKENGEEIAIKVFRDSKRDGSARHEARYVKEIEIMKRLKHDNFIKIVPVPEEFSKLSLPLLCMEYCKGGNLRELLNKPENCAGLPERTIRKCLKNVMNGLEYLHSQNIIHRDLKPENIVLQKVSDETVYKLIDLGVGKECDRSSLQTTLVGTSEYVAPDVFEAQDGYTCSVDYWSIGVICHEMITGFRPFLPHIHILKWIEKVRFKSDDVVSVFERPFEDSTNNLVFSEQLACENHITKALASYLERWLRLALMFDGKRRGRNKQNQLIFFSFLEEILNRKIITIFCTPRYEGLSYEINENTSALSIKQKILFETGLPVENQVLLLPTGRTVGDHCTVWEHWDPECEGAMLYLFTTDGISLPSTIKSPSSTVVNMIQEAKEPLPYFQRKKVFSNAVHYIQEQSALCEAFYEAVAVELLSVLNSIESLASLEENGKIGLEHCTAKLEMLQRSVQYNELRYKQAFDSKGATEFYGFLAEQKNLLNSIKFATENLKKKLARCSSQIVEVRGNFDEAQLFEGNIGEMKKCLEKSYIVIENLRTMSKELRGSESNCSEMVDIMMKFFEVIDTFVKDERFLQTIEKSNLCKKAMMPLLPKLSNLNTDAKNVNADITENELKLFKAVWDLTLQTKLLEVRNGNRTAQEDRLLTSSGAQTFSAAQQTSYQNALSLVADNQKLHQEFDETFRRHVEEFEAIKKRYCALDQEVSTPNT